MTPRSPRRAPRSRPTGSRPHSGATIPPGLELVPLRLLITSPLDARIALAPGDRALVATGEAFAAGAGLAEILRDGSTLEVAMTEETTSDGGPRPGGPWAGRTPGGRRRGRVAPVVEGEVLYGLDGRWRLAGGDVADRIEAPVSGTVQALRPGISIAIRTAARALVGASALGSPVRGRLEIAAPADGEIRAGAIDVRRQGAILVVGARVDAETLTRARAMGVHGVIVAGLAGKERRDLLASGERQLAGRHRLEPFAILVLDGTLRRSIASAHMDVFRALAGVDVGIFVDPPALVIDDAALSLPIPPADHVRIRFGALAGSEGRWAGLAGVHRFAGGVHLDAARVTLADGETVVAPLADLERFG